MSKLNQNFKVQHYLTLKVDPYHRKGIKDRQTDKQTDGRTDRQTNVKGYSYICPVANDKYKIFSFIGCIYPVNMTSPDIH